MTILEVHRGSVWRAPFLELVGRGEDEAVLMLGDRGGDDAQVLGFARGGDADVQG